MLAERLPIAEVYVDDLYDMYLLVKKVDLVLLQMKHSKERLVVVLVDEELVREKLEGKK